MYNFNETIFVSKNVGKSQNCIYQMHYKKTAIIVGIFVTSRLVKHFCCGHNVH